MEKELEEYINTLTKSGASCVKVIKPLDNIALLEELSNLPNVTLPDEFRMYLTRIDGVDQSICLELDIMDPDFAWGMEPIPVKKIISEYKTSVGMFKQSGTPEYWPEGFVPFLWNNGDFMIVNCMKDSPTFRAVYCFREGVGVNRVTNNLREFMKGCNTIMNEGLRIYEEPDFSVIADEETYFEECAKIFGNTPYYNRRGKFDTQIIDWK